MQSKETQMNIEKRLEALEEQMNEMRTLKESLVENDQRALQLLLMMEQLLQHYEQSNHGSKDSPKMSNGALLEAHGIMSRPRPVVADSPVEEDNIENGISME